MDKRKRDFVALVKSDCEKHGVKFILTNTENIDSGDSCPSSGYFEDGDKESPAKLVVGGKNKNWIETLVHEYCHMCQWLEKDPVWKHEHDNFWAWVGGSVPKLNRKHVIISVRYLRNLELDCEKRAVRMIKKYDLPIDLDRYIKGANAYVLYYSLLGKTGTWFTNSPYKQSKIMATMPNKFMPDIWYRQVTASYMSQVFTYCYSPAKKKKALAYLLAAR